MTLNIVSMLGKLVMGLMMRKLLIDYAGVRHLTQFSLLVDVLHIFIDMTCSLTSLPPPRGAISLQRNHMLGTLLFYYNFCTGSLVYPFSNRVDLLILAPWRSLASSSMMSLAYCWDIAP